MEIKEEALNEAELAMRDKLDAIIAPNDAIDIREFDSLFGFFIDDLIDMNTPEFKDSGNEGDEDYVSAEEEEAIWNDMSSKDKALSCSPLEIKKICRSDGIWKDRFDLPTILAGSFDAEVIEEAISKLNGTVESTYVTAADEATLCVDHGDKSQFFLGSEHEFLKFGDLALSEGSDKAYELLMTLVQNGKIRETEGTVGEELYFDWNNPIESVEQWIN